MNLFGITSRIEIPVFIGEAEEDIFFLGQPDQVAREVGKNAKLVKFGTEQGTGAHCQCGATVFLNQEVMEWFEEVVGKKRM